MFRLIRLLPVVIPLLTAVLRNAKVRAALHLPPRDPGKPSTKR